MIKREAVDILSRCQSVPSGQEIIMNYQSEKED